MGSILMKKAFVDSVGLNIIIVKYVTLMMGVQYAGLRFMLKMGVAMNAKNMTQAAVIVM